MKIILLCILISSLAAAAYWARPADHVAADGLAPVSG
jgi:hypothetical protein